MVRVDAPELERFTTEVLAHIGLAADDAAFAASVIVASDLAGHDSHGMRRVPEYVARWRAGGIDGAARPAIDDDGGAVLRVDGNGCLGHLALRFATDLAVERARLYGIAAVALRHSSHAGRFADYCERAAEAGVATLMFVNCSGGAQDVAPPGGLERRLATNPIAAGIPRARSPHLVLDMSTSVVAKGRLMEELDRGDPIPLDWCTPTGAIRPVGGVKGFGLALVAEALAGALTGAGTVTASPEKDEQGVLLIAIDVAKLRPFGDFSEEIERMIGYVRDVPLEDGAPPVRMPGESGATAAATNRRTGIHVRDHTWQRVLALADELAIAPPTPRSAG